MDLQADAASSQHAVLVADVWWLVVPRAPALCTHLTAALSAHPSPLTPHHTHTPSPGTQHPPGQPGHPEGSGGDCHQPRPAWGELPATRAARLGHTVWITCTASARLCTSSGCAAGPLARPARMSGRLTPDLIPALLVDKQVAGDLVWVHGSLRVRLLLAAAALLRGWGGGGAALASVHCRALSLSSQPSGAPVNGRLPGCMRACCPSCCPGRPSSLSMCLPLCPRPLPCGADLRGTAGRGRARSRAAQHRRCWPNQHYCHMAAARPPSRDSSRCQGLVCRARRWRV